MCFFSPAPVKPSSMVTLHMTSFITFITFFFFYLHPLLDFSLLSHTSPVILSNSLLWNNSPPFVRSPSHAQVYALPCKQMHSHACSHVCWCRLCVMWSQVRSFPRQTSRSEDPQLIHISTSLPSSFLLLPPFLISFQQGKCWGRRDDIIQGEPRRMYNCKNQQRWLCKAMPSLSSIIKSYQHGSFPAVV